MNIYLVVWQMPREGNTFHYGAFLTKQDATDMSDKLSQMGASEAYVANDAYGVKVSYAIKTDIRDVRDVWVVYDQEDIGEYYIFSDENDAWDKRDECISMYADMTKAPLFHN
jgi:hypothetical protein